jgi:hypothetical protein
MNNRRQIPSFLLVVLALAVFPLSARTAPNDALNPKGGYTPGLLSTLFETRARQILERHIPPKDFDLTIQVTPSAKAPPDAPYFPNALSPQALENTAPDELLPYIARIEIQVLLSTRVIKVKSKVEEILVSGLKLDKKRGDRVSFSPLGIELEPEAWTQEKTVFEGELSSTKSENDRLNRELETEKSANRKVASDQKPNPASDKSLPIVLQLIVGLVLGTAMAFAVLYLGKSVNRGLSLIAQAMRTTPGSQPTITLPQGSEGGGKVQSLEAKMISQGHGLASLPFESIQAQILSVKKEVHDNLNGVTESVILRFLTHLLSTPATVERGVVVLEILGRELSGELFSRLGFTAQEAIMGFLHQGSYSRSKMELMLEAGEELKTKLLTESFDKLRMGPSDKVAERIMQLTDEDLIQVIGELDKETLPRLFLYFDATQIASLLSKLRRSAPLLYEKSIAVFSRLPEAKATREMDTQLLRVLDQLLARMKADAERPFLKLYQDIIETSEDEIGEDVFAKLSANPRMNSFLRDNIISLHTFFGLSEKLQLEIVESLPNKEVAAFAYGMKENEKNILFALVPLRRHSLVTEEFDSFTSRGGVAAQYAYKRAKELVIRKMKEMKTEGVLTFGSETTSEPTVPTRRRNAA